MTPSHHYYDKMYIDHNTNTHFVMNFMAKMSFFRNSIQGFSFSQFGQIPSFSIFKDFPN